MKMPEKILDKNMAQTNAIFSHLNWGRLLILFTPWNPKVNIPYEVKCENHEEKSVCTMTSVYLGSQIESGNGVVGGVQFLQVY